MLGISSNLSYIHLEDFATSADYLSYMYCGLKGCIAKSTIREKVFDQKFYRASGIIKSNYQQNDTYVSMNSFFQNKRSLECLKRLNAFYVDIDCYKVGLSKEAVLDRLEHEYYGSIIPVPTFVIDSGRGLYLIWKLRNEDRKALPRWTKVQSFLIDALNELGSDPACRDAARILRVPYSFNSASGSQVKIVDFTDLTYSIYEIAKEYDIKEKSTRKEKDPARIVYPYNEATDKQRRLAIKIAAKKGLELPNFGSYLETWNWIALNSQKTQEDADTAQRTGSGIAPAIIEGYCRDIRTLLSRRSGGDCKREVALFVYRHFQYELTRDKDEALKRTLSFNANLSCPFDETYVKKVTKSAERKIDKGQGYHYRKDTLIRVLDITEEEFQHLSFLTPHRGESKKDRNHRNYVARLKAENKELKRNIREERQKQIVAMKKDGRSASEIQAALGISKATYYRELAIISAKNIIQKAKEAITETTEAGVSAAVEVIRKAADGVKNHVETCEKHRNIGKVSNIQPIIYKRMPLAFCTVKDCDSSVMPFPDKGPGVSEDLNDQGSDADTS